MCSDAPFPKAFATTRWTLVLAAGDPGNADRRQALEDLCRAYWYPLYAHVRRRGNDAHRAEDLTQGFFARLLERDDLSGLTREGGRFRSFLLTALNHFLVNEHARETAQKRGGDRVTISLDDDTAEERYQREPSHTETPDRLFERQWALTVMESALHNLDREQTLAGKGVLFSALRPFLSREPEQGEYAALAQRLALAQGTLAVQVHRLRDRYRQVVREAVADTVASPLEIDDELRHLLMAMSS
jgi:RNA polymerase sigma factor (sigma-70 family)